MIFVCLGNPGKRFFKTRHNVGRMFGDWLGDKEETIFLDCFMNDSGPTLKKVLKNKAWEIKDLIVVHDDLDLPLGEFRIQFARGAAGHHGVESVIEALGTKEFWRVRIGIGKLNNVDPEKFVLAPFKDEELLLLYQVFEKALLALEDQFIVK